MTDPVLDTARYPADTQAQDWLDEIAERPDDGEVALLVGDLRSVCRALIARTDALQRIEDMCESVTIRGDYSYTIGQIAEAARAALNGDAGNCRTGG